MFLSLRAPDASGLRLLISPLILIPREATGQEALQILPHNPKIKIGVVQILIGKAGCVKYTFDVNSAFRSYKSRKDLGSRIHEKTSI
jgi:hypothetical protein